MTILALAGLLGLHIYVPIAFPSAIVIFLHDTVALAVVLGVYIYDPISIPIRHL
jgi:hypothetical protein